MRNLTKNSENWSGDIVTVKDNFVNRESSKWEKLFHIKVKRERNMKVLEVWNSGKLKRKFYVKICRVLQVLSILYRENGGLHRGTVLATPNYRGKKRGMNGMLLNMRWEVIYESWQHLEDFKEVHFSRRNSSLWMSNQ